MTAEIQSIKDLVQGPSSSTSCFFYLSVSPSKIDQFEQKQLSIINLVSISLTALRYIYPLKIHYSVGLHFNKGDAGEGSRVDQP